MGDQDIAELFHRFFQGNITQEDKLRLAAWIRDNSEKEDLALLMEQSWREFEAGQALSAGKADQLLGSILRKGRSEDASRAGELQAVGVQSEAGMWPGAGMRRSSRSVWMGRWYRVAAAAILIGLIGWGIHFLSKRPIVQVVAAAKKDVAPPSVSNAVLTLANGQTIVLDSAANGKLAMQGRMDIVKSGDGQIAYRGKGTNGGLQYNTLTVPRGSRIATITLSDGSRVWLNAGSSITYPVAFAGAQRKVSITGEVYFEVAHAPSMPFLVRKGEEEIAVLGTHFNVNAYDDEAAMKVTLLEGAVRVNAGGGNILLKPGQMAVINPEKKIELVNDADIEQVMAWRNGLFDFDGTDIRTVMRELSRWYGVEVEYRDEIKEKFYVETNRNANVSDLFKILETTGGAHFRIEGKKIIVMK